MKRVRWARIIRLGSSMRRFWQRLCLAFNPRPINRNVQPSKQVELKPGERVYVLYLGIKEYNGNFKEEIHFRNAWTDHEGAQHWLRFLKAEIEVLMKSAGVEPMAHESLTFEEQAEESF